MDNTTTVGDIAERLAEVMLDAARKDGQSNALARLRSGKWIMILSPDEPDKMDAMIQAAIHITSNEGELQ